VFKQLHGDELFGPITRFALLFFLVQLINEVDGVLEANRLAMVN
jgi:hypothetical protein